MTRVIEVPIDNSNDVLEIDCSQLPEHASEICDILENEGGALRFYSLFAQEYYQQGHIDEAMVALKRGMANARANDQTAKVPLLNFLASIYVQKAKSTADREMTLRMAATLLTEAERINGNEPNTHLIRGMLELTKRVPEAALRCFSMALRVDPRNLAAMLGKARVLLGKRQYQQALAIYQQVLIHRPMGKPDVRIGIGICLSKLGHTEDARRALARASEVDPAAAAPHILLATLDLNQVKQNLNQGQSLDSVSQLLGQAMAHLQRAYQLQPDNAATLLRLSDRLFFQSNHDAALTLAERALKSADTMAIQAEAHYQIGRAHHAAGKFDQAHDAYQRCLQINEHHSLARYGLGQMQLQRSDMSSAEATFQRVLEKQPKCVEVLRALGYLHARLPNTKAKALEYYEKEMQVISDEAASDAVEWFDDANLFLESGLLYEATNAKRARKAYGVAARIMQRTQEDIPELWNNLGALSQLSGCDESVVFSEYQKAAQKCTQALSDARQQKSANETQRLESSLVTITYNTARFYERCGMWSHAEKLYQQLVQDVPSYVDARLRLAHIAYFCHSDASGALSLISQVIELDSKKPAAWLMRGNIEYQRKNVQQARRAFEHVLKDIAKHDIYALCSLGNYYLAAGKSEANRASANQDKKTKELAAQNYKRAVEFFDKCLQLDERCASAAHGMAIAMAERGMAKEARGVFQDVRDAATSGLGPAALTNPVSDLVFKIAQDTACGSPTQSEEQLPVSCDVLLWSSINTAHTLVELGSYRQAVLSYEASIRRLQETTQAMEHARSASDTEKLVIAAINSVADDKTQTVTRLTEAEKTKRSQVERDLRLYLTRALYIQAKVAKDVDIMKAALTNIRTLLCKDINIAVPTDESTKISPDDSQILFDLALVEQSVAQLVSEQPESQRTLQDMSLATEDIEHSTRTFEWLAQWGEKNKKKHKLLFSLRLATERAGYSKSLLAKLARKQQEQEEFERQRQEHVEQWKKQQEEEELKKREEAEQQAIRMREQEEALLREAGERNAILREQMATAAPVEAADDAERPTKKSSSGRRRRRDGNDEEGPIKKRQRNDSAAHEEDPTKYKSKAVVTDSDDDDDDGDGDGDE